MNRAESNRWLRLFEAQHRRVALRTPNQPIGKLQRVNGMRLEISGLQAPLGALIDVDRFETEVVGFAQDRLYTMATEDLTGCAPGAKAQLREPLAPAPSLAAAPHPWRRATDLMRHLPLGLGLLGRVVDARGAPMDGLGPLINVEHQPIHRRPINAMERQPVREPLDCGVRSINALLTLGVGQRVGLFAGPGLGKSMLMGMMARHTACDVIVVGLIGERGREVKEFIEDILGEQGLARSVVVAAPADCAPVLRLQGANYATAVAEYFRDQGLRVLLLMDSLTRYAMAAREVALSVGEAPATKGYPASVFARLPQLVERAGNDARGQGSITAVYTVLSEGDDQNDPIAEAARSFLDGHLVLSRQLADAGHYPAIDIERSISRVMHSVNPPDHLEAARVVRELWSAYQVSRDLIQVGAYVHGSDSLTDRAIAFHGPMRQLLRQQATDIVDFSHSVDALRELAQAAMLQSAPVAESSS